jgi:hypothetical protein
MGQRILDTIMLKRPTGGGTADFKRKARIFAFTARGSVWGTKASYHLSLIKTPRDINAFPRGQRI